MNMQVQLSQLKSYNKSCSTLLFREISFLTSVMSYAPIECEIFQYMLYFHITDGMLSVLMMKSIPLVWSYKLGLQYVRFTIPRSQESIIEKEHRNKEI